MGKVGTARVLQVCVTPPHPQPPPPPLSLPCLSRQRLTSPSRSHSRLGRGSFRPAGDPERGSLRGNREERCEMGHFRLASHDREVADEELTPIICSARPLCQIE